jgi:hypothetical protein
MPYSGHPSPFQLQEFFGSQATCGSTQEEVKEPTVSSTWMAMILVMKPAL